MKMAFFLATALLIAACGPVETPAKRGAARVELFKECMDLAAKMPRQADDDVADVVNSCANQSSYMTNYIN